MPGESITFTVRGTFRSEFRARFCATRLTYSLTTGSVMIFADLSICDAYSLPAAISFSSEIRLRWATRRLPISLGSFFLWSPAQPGRADARKSRLSAKDVVARCFIGWTLPARSSRLYILGVHMASSLSASDLVPYYWFASHSYGLMGMDFGCTMCE